ncbi:MAG TPA: CAP domain-containing protein, partial [Thermoanaerobaculia bacterium]|nr:CAP domain-containing protein [Thermoanaerobaculia bacterium]
MTRLLALATALLLAAASPAQPAGDEESLRQAFLAAFNRERAEARAPALGLSRRLVTAAQQHADDISRRANLRTGPADQERMDERLHKEGYHSQRWTESVISSTEEIGSVVRYWKRESGDLYRQVMDPDFREIGIGISELDGVPLYTFLFAVPEESYYESRTADLKDLRAVRQAILAKTNAQRARAGARPLVANSLLDRAAQGHAEDMLRRGYFAH